MSNCNFLSVITDYVGSIPSTIPDNGKCLFESAIVDVINRIRQINPSKLYMFAKTNSVTIVAGLH